MRMARSVPMLALLASPCLAFGSGAERLKFGGMEVDYTYIRWGDLEPLQNPARLMKVEGNRLILADGRRVDAEDASWFARWLTAVDPNRDEVIIDVTPEPDGTVAIHMHRSLIPCPNSTIDIPRNVLPVPIFPRTLYRVYRAKITTGRVVGTAPNRKP